jgi:hypothetical protein
MRFARSGDVEILVRLRRRAEIIFVTVTFIQPLRGPTQIPLQRLLPGTQSKDSRPRFGGALSFGVQTAPAD